VRLRQQGADSILLPKVHPAECAETCLETLGFRSAGAHFLYATTARSA
jgi:hypothetical protein